MTAEIFPGNLVLSFMYQGLFALFARVRSGDPVRVFYVYSTTNTLDIIEAFIAETMYNLLLPNLMCYSTSCLHLCNCSAVCPANAHHTCTVQWLK